MSERFKVGEMAVIQNAEIYPSLNGTLVTILAANVTGRSPDGRIYLCYEVDFANPRGLRNLIAKPHQLRRRKPPTTGEQFVMELFKVTPQPTRVTA